VVGSSFRLPVFRFSVIQSSTDSVPLYSSASGRPGKCGGRWRLTPSLQLAGHGLPPGKSTQKQDNSSLWKNV